MKRAHEDPESLAVRVADGQAVDWDEALRGASNDQERGVIRHLRLVESVARVHRSSGSLAPSEEPFTLAAGVAAARRPAPAPASGRWGPLELKERLGAGGFGEVYRAFDRHLDRDVALKLLKDQASSTIIAEGRMMARLRHPNVVSVYGAEIHDGRVGIWMELIRGRSLEQLLQDHGPFGAREAALIGIDLCRALAAVHRAGVVHRDVKAANAMREEGGRILLTDFGAGIELASEQRPGRTSISGTPFYMAPEQLRGRPATQRSDIYSLGVLLYRIVTASFPIEASTWSELLDRHARREARLLRDQRPDLPEGFVAVVERAMAWDAEGRFGTAGQMEQALSQSLGSAGAPATDRIPLFRRRPAVAFGAVGLLAAAGVWMLVTPELPTLPDQPFARPAAVGSPADAPGSPPSPAPYSVEAALYRVSGESSRRERLESGARLQLGDRLTLTLRASAPLHVYVINEDEAGHSYALFPLPGLQPQNPLPPDATHSLPGSRDGKELSWTVDSPGGREHLMVLASPTRLVEFEAELNALARPGQMAVPIPDGAGVRLRGIGGLNEAPSQRADGPAGRLFEMAERLASRSETVSGVWMRRIDLENPR